jgi:hypothetical protein
MDKLFLPKMDREYLEAKGLQFLEQVDAGRFGLILKSYRLPVNKYQVSYTDLLIIIPQGYNDTHPDMFYCNPTLTLLPNNSQPAQTSGILSFDGLNWQQWSRHLNVGNDWRPGIDGIQSYLQKVNTALRIG